MCECAIGFKEPVLENYYSVWTRQCKKCGEKQIKAIDYMSFADFTEVYKGLVNEKNI